MSYDLTKRKPAIRHRGRLRECATRACSAWIAAEVRGDLCRNCSGRRRAATTPTKETRTDER